MNFRLLEWFKFIVEFLLYYRNDLYLWFDLKIIDSKL